MTRTQAALIAIRRELERRQPVLDASEDVVQVVLTIKFVAATGQVRGLVYQEERLEARNGPA